MASKDSYPLQGQGGLIVLTAGQSSDDPAVNGGYTGKYRWLQVAADAVLSGLVVQNSTGADDLSSVPFAQGFAMGGVITFVSVDTGIVILYKE